LRIVTIDAGLLMAAPARPRLDVRGWILLAGVTLLVASTGLFLLLAQSHRQATLRDAETTAQNLARMLAEHAARVFDVANLMAEQAMQLAHGHGWDELERSRAVHEDLKRLSRIHPFVSAIWLVDEAGWPRVSTRSFPPPAQTVGDRAHFIAQAIEDVGPFVTPLIRSRVRDESNIVMSRRLNGPDGGFRGVALSVIEPADFARVYAGVQSRFPVVIEMFRRDMALLIRQPGTIEEGETKRVALPPGDEIRSGSVGWNDSPGQPRMIEAYATVGSFRLYVGVGIAEAEIDKVWSAEIIPQATFAGVGLIVILVFMTVALVRARKEAEARAEALALNMTLESRVHERTSTVEQLLLELNHRVKNSLQLVASLLRIQAAASTPDARLQLDEARGRVMAIARAHERLHKTGRIRSIDFDALLRDVADDLLVSLAKGRAISTEIESVALPLAVEKAMPLALATGEIVTNALKYAFPEDEGTITITLARTGAEEARLVIADDGRGLPEDFRPEASAGIGMRLITGLVGQIGGQLACSNDPEGGARFEIVFPTGPEPQETPLRGNG